MAKKVIVIGGGIAGMESAAQMARMGYDVSLLEQKNTLGGNAAKWDRLFPTLKPSQEVIDNLKNNILKNNVKVHFGAEVFAVVRQENQFTVTITDGQKFEADSILLATGFQLFNAKRKEEYGYGIYNNVITSADLEEIFQAKKGLKTVSGKTPKKVGIIHCVGSRDVKCGNGYCSSVCCITAVKQAIEIKELVPDAEVYCFYMDLRMFGRYFEDIYKKAQEKFGVQFVRGRLSEAVENPDESVMLKVEDTLAGKPMKISVDMVVLMAGMEASTGTTRLGHLLNLNFGDDRFLQPTNEHLMRNITKAAGVFVAGTSTGPKSIYESISDARGAALAIDAYLKQN